MEIRSRKIASTIISFLTLSFSFSRYYVVAFLPTFTSNHFKLSFAETSRPIQHTFLAESKSTTDSLPLANEFDWDRIAEEVFEKDKRPVILFDGVCNLCNGGVNFALDNDSVGKINCATHKHIALNSERP
jgi:hypothetical protein